MKKSARWKILDTGRSSAKENMDLDDKLLHHIEEFEEPILHLYKWNDSSGTYGYFSQPEKLLNLEALTHYKIELARRPTGGGILFHLTDFAFSILVPASHSAYSLNTLENYAFVNNLVLQTLMSLKLLHQEPQPHLLLKEASPSIQEAQHFCMAKPTIYDIIHEGKKIGGGAQRRTKKGFLHQGTISITTPDEEFLNRVLVNPEVLTAMKVNSGLLLKDKANTTDLEDVREVIRKGLVQTILDL